MRAFLSISLSVACFKFWFSFLVDMNLWVSKWKKCVRLGIFFGDVQRVRRVGGGGVLSKSSLLRVLLCHLISGSIGSSRYAPDPSRFINIRELRLNICDYRDYWTRVWLFVISNWLNRIDSKFLSLAHLNNTSRSSELQIKTIGEKKAQIASVISEIAIVRNICISSFFLPLVFSRFETSKKRGRI